MTIAVALLCDDCGVEDVRDRASGAGQALGWCLSKVFNSSPLMATRLQNGGRAPRSVALQLHLQERRLEEPLAAQPRDYLLSAAAWAPGRHVQRAFHTVTI